MVKKEKEDISPVHFSEDGMVLRTDKALALPGQVGTPNFDHFAKGTLLAMESVSSVLKRCV